jgi:hypothetical protein
MNQTAQQDLRDEEIVALCQQGRGEVFEVFVRKYMEKAFRIASTSRMIPKKQGPLRKLKSAFSRIKRLTAI